MKPADRLLRTLSYIAREARSKRLKALGGATAQYMYKYDDVDYHVKIVAELTSTTAIVTQSVVFGEEPPEVTTIEVAYEKDDVVFPLGIGCPVDAYIYTFNEFECANEKELKMYFSKSTVDYGEGQAYVMGTALTSLDVLDVIYPCSKS